MKEKPTKRRHRFSSGAVRSEVKPRYDLIPLVALRRLANRYGLGAVKYGDYNWLKGGPDFVKDVPNHIIEHIFLWVSGDRAEDHLAAAAWGCCALMHFEEQDAV